jgi:hypothetical protein
LWYTPGVEVRRVIDPLTGQWRTAVGAPPVVKVAGKDAPTITATLDRLEAQVAALAERVAGKADGAHSHTIGDVEGFAALAARVAVLEGMLAEAEAELAARPTLDTVVTLLAGKADVAHRHTSDEIDADGRYPTLTGGKLDRAVLPPLEPDDLPAHGHRASQITGLGSLAGRDAADLDDLKARVAQLEKAAP